tara:strand:- start:3616 stop:4320 length:705 start_codon:yes stop_codon:yes gene_type:complete
MKKVIALVALIGLSSTAQADGWWYYETPEFFQYEETVMSCKTEIRETTYRKYRQLVCDHPFDSPSRVYRSTATDGNRVFSKMESRYVDVTCRSGICTTKEDEYVGRLDVSVATFSLTRGHYIYQDENGDIRQYRRGTGPMADRFPLYKIDILEGLAEFAEPEVPESAFGNISLHCNPMNETCYFNDEIVFMEDLPEYFSMADVDAEASDSHFCDLGLCWSNEGGFIGLNPFYYQ